MIRLVGILITLTALSALAVFVSSCAAEAPTTPPSTGSPAEITAKPAATETISEIPLRFLGRYRKTTGAFNLLTVEITNTTLITTSPKFAEPGAIAEDRYHPAKIVLRADGALVLTRIEGELTWNEIFVLTEPGIAVYRQAEGTTVELGRLTRH